MIEIQNTIVEDNISDIRFACSTSACKGACCTLQGGEGAPLLDAELEWIENSFPIIKSYLPQEHLDTIVQLGLYEGVPGAYTTMCFNSRACVFVFYEEGIARCAFEKAFFEGKIKWRKPISCHLFPIRIERGMKHLLRYERISECDPALDCGQQDNIYLINFLKEPLVRAFGSSWYEDFLFECELKRKETEAT
jgi:hypothetical protein